MIVTVTAIGLTKNGHTKPLFLKITDCSVPPHTLYETLEIFEIVVDVVLPQLDRVCLQDPVLQISCSEVDEDVHQVNKVGEVIKREPDHHRGPLYFIKGGPVDNDLKDTFR